MQRTNTALRRSCTSAHVGIEKRDRIGNCTAAHTASGLFSKKDALQIAASG